MSEEKKTFLSKINILKKIKLSKNMSITIAIILSIIAILIFSSSFKDYVDTDGSQDLSYTSMISYTQDMENKLKSVLLSMKGVENAEVMIAFDSGVELLIASTKETKTITNGSSSTVVVVETPVLVTEKGVSKPIVLQEKLPKPVSVFIVAKGAEDTKVRLNIMKAIEVLFNLEASQIEVLIGK